MPLTSNPLSCHQYSHLTIKQLKSNFSSYPIDYYTPIQHYLKPFANNAKQIMSLSANNTKKQQMMFQMVQQIKRDDKEYLRLKDFVKQKIKHNVPKEASFTLIVQENLCRILGKTKIVSKICTILCPCSGRHSISNYVGSYGKRCQQTSRQRRNSSYTTTKQPHTTSNNSWFGRYKNYAAANPWCQNPTKWQFAQAYFNISQSKPTPCHPILHIIYYYQVEKISLLGAIYCGLEDLVRFYFQSNLQNRMSNLWEVLEIVDAESKSLIWQAYFDKEELFDQSQKQLNQLFQHFRLSLGATSINYQASQYIIDQLLIKKRNKFDIYIVFAIMILALGDHIDQILRKQQIRTQQSLGIQESQKVSLKELFYQSKQKINAQQIIQCFKTIYQKIPATSLTITQPNKLLQKLIQYQQQNDINLINQPKQQQQDDKQYQLDKQLKRWRNYSGVSLYKDEEIVRRENGIVRIGEMFKNK